MLLVLAAAAGATDQLPDSTAAGIIAAIGVLIVGILGAVGVFIKNADARIDRSRDESQKILEEARDDAMAGEAQMRKERDEALTQRAEAYKERDRWMEKWAEEQARANALEVRLMIARSTQDPRGEGL